MAKTIEWPGSKVMGGGPSADEFADIAVMAADAIRRVGLAPRVAFVWHAPYGSSKRPCAVKVRRARELLMVRMPDVPAG